MVSTGDKIRELRAKQWFLDRGDETYRVNYNLNRKSIVFDLGGYKGEWSKKIYDKYGCKIFIFEPVRAFYEIISKQFEGNSDIKVFNFGLGGSDFTANIKVEEDASRISLDTSGESSEAICIKSFVDFIQDHAVENIDLMKVNIEGAEYDLLECIIENELICKIANLQIQFHDFEESHISRMSAIQKRLDATHCLSYQYYLVWENWTRKDLLTFDEFKKIISFFQFCNIRNGNEKNETTVELIETREKLSDLSNAYDTLRCKLCTIENSIDYRWGKKIVDFLRKLKGIKSNG